MITDTIDRTHAVSINSLENLYEDAAELFRDAEQVADDIANLVSRLEETLAAIAIAQRAQPFFINGATCSDLSV
ncbi:MAG: hypothetical protein R3A44_10270 [Caldilineaceae bacterium]